jgi:hypothetical protein
VENSVWKGMWTCRKADYRKGRKGTIFSEDDVPVIFEVVQKEYEEDLRYRVTKKFLCT